MEMSNHTKHDPFIPIFICQFMEQLIYPNIVPNSENLSMSKIHPSLPLRGEIYKLP